MILKGLRSFKILTGALISLWGHTPNKLHRMITILDLKVLFELKIMPLPRHSFFVHTSFAKNPILTFFLWHKLRTFVNDWWCWTRTGLKGSVEHSCKWCDHRQRSICCTFQIVPKIERKSSFNNASEASYVYMWVDKSSLKMPKLVHFGEFLKTWSLWSNSVTRKVSIGKKLVENSNATF